MKKSILFFAGLMIVAPFVARAEDDALPINPNAKIITDSYLQGALLNKQDKLSDANIIINGDDTGDVITNISASDGVLTITKGTMPSGVNVVYEGTADAPVVTNVTADDDGNVTVTRGSVKIPVGGEEATEGLASIWIQ